MTNPNYWDALKPVAARMPKVVREHEILRVSATVCGTDVSEAAKAARYEVLKWAERRCGGRLPQEAWDYQSFEYFSGGRNSNGARIENGDIDIWAIRADDPDKNVPGRTWTTEVVVGFMDKQPARFSARLLVSTSEEELNIEPHTPGLVRQVVEHCGLSQGPFKLDVRPWLIDSDDTADAVIKMLVDQSRKFPVFVLTVPDNYGDPAQPLLDADSLARAILGIGYVAVVPAAYTWVLTERFGKQRSVFGGAVRAYLPGFSDDANPYGHRLVLAEHISEEDAAGKCIRWMRSLAATESVRRAQLGTDVLAFAQIRVGSLQLKQERLKQDGASDRDQLEAAKVSIKALESQCREQEGFLKYFGDEHKKAEERAETAERQRDASAFRIQQLLDQLKQHQENPDANITLPKTWPEFVDWCDEHMAGRVVLYSTARRNAKSPEFTDVQLAARCVLWLANECRERRINGGDGSLNEEIVEDGIRNAHCGNDQFDLDWSGQRYTADWHIKNGGNTRDPKRCLRIYYFWDPATQQIIVADMPAHRRTGAS